MKKTAKSKEECGDLLYILTELSKVTKELEIHDLDIDPDIDNLDSVPKFLALADLFNINVANVYLMSYRMHFFTDYSRGGVKRSIFNANLNGVYDFSRKLHRESQCDVYLDSGDQHWMTSRPCYAGKKYEKNHADFLEKLDTNLIKLLNNCSNDVLIIDLKSKKYLMHRTEDNGATHKLLKEKFPLSKVSRPQVKIAKTSLILKCIKVLKLKNIGLDQADVIFNEHFEFNSGIGFTRYIPFTFYGTSLDSGMQHVEMLLDLTDSSVFSFKDILSDWLNGETCEYDLKRWLIIRHITQPNEIVSVH